ncbi:cytochrome P450, partial [Artomyces pyxidatus]
PPGPKGWPLLGNVLIIPQHAPWKTYASWSRKFDSELISINAFGRLSIIINSRRAAKELFESRSAIYADRPSNRMIELMGWDITILARPLSQEVRTQRKMFNQSLRPAAIPSYHSMHEAQTQDALKNILADPEHFRSYVQHYASWIAMSVAYGRDLSPADRFITVARKASAYLGASILPGAVAVNSYTFLSRLPRWLPGMGFKAHAAECRLLTTEILESPFAEVKSGMAEGMARSSIAATNLEVNEARGGGVDGEGLIKRAAASVYLGEHPRTEKTSSGIMSAILAMALYPFARRRAQAELDCVVGRSCLPTFADRLSLPYVDAFVREVLRWRVIFPMGLPRMSDREDTYNGYTIPKSAFRIPFMAILHDPETYPDPESFVPERFLTAEGTLNDDGVPETFGLGRRFCPGMYYADASMWIMVASLLAVFDVTQAKDENGRDIQLEVEFTDGIVSHPFPFACVIRPRDQQAVGVIRQDGQGEEALSVV